MTIGLSITSPGSRGLLNFKRAAHDLYIGDLLTVVIFSVLGSRGGGERTAGATIKAPTWYVPVDAVNIISVHGRDLQWTQALNWNVSLCMQNPSITMLNSLKCASQRSSQNSVGNVRGWVIYSIQITQISTQPDLVTRKSNNFYMVRNRHAYYHTELGSEN